MEAILVLLISPPLNGNVVMLVQGCRVALVMRIQIGVLRIYTCCPRQACIFQQVNGLFFA